MTKADQLLDAATIDLVNFHENMIACPDADDAHTQARDVIIAIATYAIQVHIQANP